MKTKNKRAVAPCAGTAWFIFIFVILIVLYMLSVPPEFRDALLNGVK